MERTKKHKCTKYEIDIEYTQWQLTRTLIEHIIDNYGQYKFIVYEFHNIMKQLLMAMCNSPLRSRLTAPWTIYYNIKVGDPFIQQLNIELIQKCGVGKLVTDIVNYIIDTVNSTVSSTPPTYELPGVIKIFKNRVSYRSFMLDMQPCQTSKLKRFHRRTMMAMIIRYSTIIIKSQQWSLPLTLFNVLYKNYNVRFEGFASPLNNCFDRYKNAEYCSLFKSDEYFGSIGNFFNIDIDNPIRGIKLDNIGWIIHPPYVLDIMMKAFQQICNGLANALLKGINMFVLFVIPYWVDSDVYRAVKRTHYNYTEIVMSRHTHFYENHGNYINSSFDTVLFIFHENNDVRKYSDIIDAIYVKNMPSNNNIPKSLRMFMNIDNFQRVSIVDNDDDTNSVVLNNESTSKTTWRIRYNSDNHNYVIRNKDISPLIVGLM